MSEKELVKKITDYLTSLQKMGYLIYFEKRRVGGYGYKKGIPDLWFVCNGVHCELEFKNPKLKNPRSSPLQEYWKNYFQRININYLISNNEDEIKNWIQQFLVWEKI